MNKTWHAAHRMPAKPTVEQRIAWHTQHAEHCGCRPVPASLRKRVQTRPPRKWPRSIP